MMDNKRIPRRNYFIKKRSQGKFILLFVISSLAGGMLAVALFIYLAYLKIDSVLYSMRLPQISTGGLLLKEMLYADIFIVLFIIIVFTITARSLFIRITGPLRKIAADLKIAANGKLDFKVELLRHDDFQDFADDLNAMLTALNIDFTKIRESNDSITELLNNTESYQDMESTAANVKKQINTMETIIGKYRK